VIPFSSLIITKVSQSAKKEFCNFGKSCGSFRGEEYERLLEVIQRSEGWFSGDESFKPAKDQIVGVKLSKHKAPNF
jgi:hypothetical protein